MSVPIRLPALGLGVLQLQPDLDGPYTLPSSVRIYLNGAKLSIGRQAAFPLRVMDSSPSDFAISNRYMQVWFSGLTGLLKVKGQARVGGEGPEKGTGIRRLCTAVPGPACACHLTHRGLGVSVSSSQADSMAQLSALTVCYCVCNL